MVEALIREPGGQEEGALVLFHGRGADEHDLHPLLDVLDPHKRLRGITPRGPLSLPPGGAHWYAVREIGFPEPTTFHSTFREVSEWLDGLGLHWDRTILGGFSQGAVMSYALSLGKGRPRPAGVIALSGFIPTVDDFELDVDGRLPRIAIGHGNFDPVIEVKWGRRARMLLEQVGAEVLYREYPLPHAIDPRFLGELRMWVSGVLSARPTASG